MVRSLKIRLLLVVLVSLAPALAFEVWIERDATQLRHRLVENEAMRLLRLVLAQQQRIFDGAEQTLYAIASAPAIQTGDAAGCHAMLARLVAQVPRYNNAVVTGPHGEVLCVAVGNDLSPGVGDRPYFQAALQAGGFIIGEYTIGRFSGLPAIHMAQPFRDASGKVAGVVAVALSTDWLGHELETLGLPPEAAVSVSDRNGIIVARHPGGSRYVGQPVTADARVALESALTGVSPMTGLEGRPRIVAFAPLGGPLLGLRVAIGLDRDSAFAEVTQANRLGLLLIVLGAGLGLATSLLGGRLISRPVERLLAACRQWTADDLAVRTGLRHDRSEFGRLAAGFDAMAEAHQARERDLRQTEAELRRLAADLESRVQQEVAAREAAQQRAAVAERQQALGQLAAGIAHDFNNVLQSIVSAAGLIENHCGDAPLVRRWARIVSEATARGAAITARLLAFGRRGALAPEPVDAATLLQELQEVLAHTLGAGIDVEVSVPAGLPLLLADRAQLENALVNLAANARDAMPGGGRLTLSASSATVADGCDAGPAAGEYVRIVVADNGIGMDADTLARAAEPFFTTKGPGRGTGLGLPLARCFAEQSGGALAITSLPGDGTTVTLWLPQAPAGAAAPSRAAPATLPDVDGAGLCVLLVDDEPLLREVLSEFLEEWRFSVCSAAGGVEALALLDAGEAVDVLVTDLSMPGMDGIALIRAAQDRRPGLPAILLTGYAGEVMFPALQEAGVAVVRKPVSGADLVVRIAALAGRGPPPRHAVRRAARR
jgi:signal transduction histidine kinase